MSTATLTRKTKSAKTVNIQDRKDFGNGYVVYTVLSSNGVDQHRTTLVNGHTTGCTCRERNGVIVSHKCYHGVGCEQNEATRNTDQQQHVLDDLYPGLHSCYGCGYLLKHAGYCCKCA